MSLSRTARRTSRRLSCLGNPAEDFNADVNVGRLSLISEPSVVTRVILEAARAAR